MTQDTSSDDASLENAAAQEEPEVFAVKKDLTGWRYTRRGFLASIAAAAAGGAAVAAGCDGSQPDEATEMVAQVTTAPTVRPTRTRRPTKTPRPTRTPTSTPVPVPGFCFVSDVSVPDNTPMEPGQSFTKTWRVTNCGDAAFGSGATLRFVEGNRMSGAESVEVEDLAPGETTDVSVDMKAPSQSGAHKGAWRLHLPDGTPIGDTVWVLVVVATSPDIPEGEEGVKVKVGDREWTLPCGSPLPAGAVCTCNCVPGAPSCECVVVNHYWYPN